MSWFTGGRVPHGQIEKDIYEAVRFHAEKILDPRMIGDFMRGSIKAEVIDHAIQSTARELLVRLTGSMLARTAATGSTVVCFNEKCIVTFTWEHPASWWQHFKHDCFPQWLLKRFPVKMKSNTLIQERNVKGEKIVHFEKLVGFPLLNQPFDERKHVVIYRERPRP